MSGDYGERKFRRFMRQAERVPVYERWHGTVDGNVFDIEVRRAYRSKGYRSEYEPVLCYWFFSRRDGVPVWAKTATPAVFERITGELRERGLTPVRV